MKDKIQITEEQEYNLKRMNEEDVGRLLFYLFKNRGVCGSFERQFGFLRNIKKEDILKVLFEEDGYELSDVFKKGEWVWVFDGLNPPLPHKIVMKKGFGEYRAKTKKGLLGMRVINKNDIVRRMFKEEAVVAEFNLKWEGVKVGDVVQHLSHQALGVVEEMCDDIISVRISKFELLEWKYEDCKLYAPL